MKNNQGGSLASKPTTTNAPAPAPAAKPTTTPTATKPDTNALRALTEKLAYDLWEKKGRKHGSELGDWLEAEKLARQKLGL